MLGKTLHIRDSAFRMLPNPIPYHWDKNFFNIKGLATEYQKRISDSDADLPQVPQIEKLRDDADTVVRALQADKKSMTPGYSIPLLNTLHDVLDGCDEFLREGDRNLVRMVVREHFQEVLKMINDNSGADGDGDAERAVHFDDLTAASPKERQEVFMDLYFFKVLNQVRERAVMSYRARRVRFPLPDNGDDATISLEPQASAIWCTLVLRMVCWLLLHDFDQQDVQIPKSELLGSRLPVYIA